MTVFYEAPDGHGESTIWAQARRTAEPVVCESDVAPGYWGEIVAALTATDPDDDACMECFELVGRGEPHGPGCSDYLAPMVDVHLPGDAAPALTGEK